MSGEALFEVEAPETATAVVSDCGRYRYHLTRRWGPGPLLPFLMCNPSKADHRLNDPTIVRCDGFAHRLGFDGFEVLNAYGWRATKVTDMWAAMRAGHDVVGPDNDGWLADLFRRAVMHDIPIIAAWGAHPKPERVAQVLSLPHADRLQSLGTTQGGQPRHPLMLRSDTPLAPWPPAEPHARIAESSQLAAFPPQPRPPRVALTGVLAVGEGAAESAYTPVDPYCPEHGTLPTTYNECSCEARARLSIAQRPCGCDRPDMKPDHPRMAGCSLYSCHDISVCAPMYGPKGCWSSCCHLRNVR